MDLTHFHTDSNVRRGYAVAVHLIKQDEHHVVTHDGCRTEKESREPEILTVEEVAARLRVPKSWVYSHADQLGAYRVGKYLRFSWKRVVASLESPPSTQSSTPQIESAGGAKC